MQVLPILRALAPLIAEAGGMVAGMRSTGRAAKLDERVDKLEGEMLRAGEVLAGVAQQLQAIAQEMRAQAEATERLQRRAQAMLIVGLAAAALSVAAIVVVLVR